MQTETGVVASNSLLSLLVAFHRDKLTLRQRHVAIARIVADYNFNNTYQQVLSREDVHLSWLESAIVELGGAYEDVEEPNIGSLKSLASAVPFVAEDAREVAAFVERWRPRLAEVTNARHRNMVNVILGETIEHKHFFDQIVAGREDVLGRRSNGPGSPGTGNGVLPVRWIE
jgi:hypothetical protein